MASVFRATLDGTQLPVQFSYTPYIPKKRVTSTPTANAVVVQSASPQIVHGDGALKWKCDACYPAEFKQFWDWYMTASPTIYSFVGYWGETLDVLFSEFDEPVVRSRLFNLAGQFQVLSVTASPNPDCWSV